MITAWAACTAGVGWAVFASYRAAWRAGYRAGWNACPVPEPVHYVTIDIPPAKPVRAKPELKVVPAAEPEIPLTREAISKALAVEINKGRKGNPDEVDRLVALNNALVRQQRSVSR